MKRLIVVFLIILSSFSFSACKHLDISTTDKYPITFIDETPTLSQFERFRVIPADDTSVEGYQAKILTNNQLTLWFRQQLRRVKFEISPPLDARYFILDKENMLIAFDKFYRENKHWQYAISARDCDDFAFAFKNWIQFEMADDYLELEATSSVAVVFVRQRHAWGGVPAGNAHALIMVVTNEGGIMYEPQTGEWCMLEDYPNREHIYYILR